MFPLARSKGPAETPGFFYHPRRRRRPGEYCRVMVGTAGSHEKAEIAKVHGCDHVLLYREVDLVAAVKAIAPQGVAAVFDGVGRDTFVACLDCVRPFGMLVNYGNASGHPPPIDLLQLAKRGSLSICRPALSSFITDVTTMHSSFRLRLPRAAPGCRACGRARARAACPSAAA